VVRAYVFVKIFKSMKHVFKLSSLGAEKSERGITLVELVVVIFIIALFSTILVANFPEIQRQFALSRATYRLAQDLRTAQGLGLSGVPITDKNGTAILAKGYGIYINLSNSATKYVIYADVPGAAVNGVRTSDQKYSGDLSYPLCVNVNQLPPIGALATDCVISVVDISKVENPSLYIKGITDCTQSGCVADSGGGVSINFNPPNPTTSMTGSGGTYSAVNLTLGLRTSSSSGRTISVNTFGLIDIN